MYENILSNMLGCQTYCISDSPWIDEDFNPRGLTYSHS